MRVLHVIDGLGGSGGAERRFVEELEAWPQPDEHRVLRLFHYDDLSSRLDRIGVEVRPMGFRASRGSWSWPSVARRVAAEIRRYQPDVVHTSLFHADVGGQLGAWRRRAPVVGSIVNAPEGPATRAEAALGRLRYAIARSSGARWRAVTAAAAANAVASGADPASITVVPRGIRIYPLPPVPDRSRFGLPDHGRLVVHVGRQATTKGQVMLVDVVARLRATHPDLRLVVAGRAGDASTALCDAVRANGLSDVFHDLGFQEEVGPLLACADVVVRPSTEEGFAAGVLEGVAAGRPVLASDIAPHREVAGPLDLAAFAPVGDPAAWAEALRTILDDPPPPAELAARRERARAAYSTEAAAGGLRELLRSVARAPMP